MNDLISKQTAIDGFYEMASDMDHLCTVSDYVSFLESLPSAQPEPCEDTVSREAVSEWLKQYGQDVLHGKYKFSLMYIWRNLMDLPSAQPEPIKINIEDFNKEDLERFKKEWGNTPITVLPVQTEIKPIDYQYCSNAMLMMWIDNVITDGEYNKIMDNLNAKHIAERREE